MSGVFQGGDIVFGVRYDDPALARSMGKLQNTINTSMASVGQSTARVGASMSALGGTIAGALGYAAKGAMNFQGALAKVATMGVDDLEGLGDTIKDVSMKFGLDLVDSVEAVYQSLSAGAKETEVPYLLERAAIAATAGMSDLTTAVDLGTSVANAFGIEYTEMGGIFDAAFVAVKQGKTEFGELSTSLGRLSPAFASAGLSSDEMFASVAALTKGGNATAESVTKLNAIITGFVRQGEQGKLTTLGFQGALEWLKEETGGNAEQMLKFVGSTEALSAVMSLTGELSGALTESLGAMANKTGMAQDAFDAFAEANPELAWKQLGTMIQVLRIEIGNALLPILARIVEFVKPIVMTIIEWTKENKALVSGLVIAAAAFAGLLLVLGPVIATVGMALFIFSGLSVPVLAAGAAIGVVLAGAFTFLMSKMNQLIEWTRRNWDRLVVLFNVGSEIITNMMLAMGYMWKGIFTIIGSILSTFLGESLDFWNELSGDAGTGTGDWIEQVTRLARQAEKLTEQILDIMGSFSETTKKYWDEIAFVARLAYKVWDTTTGNLVRMIGWLVYALQKLYRWSYMAMGALGMVDISKMSGKLSMAGVAGKVSPQSNNSFNAPIGNISVSVNGSSGNGDLIAQEIARELPKVLMREIRTRAQQTGVAFGV